VANGAERDRLLVRLISGVLRPGHFYTDKKLHLEFVHRDRDTIAWEIYRGRLLPPEQTRQQQQFESWNVFRIEDDDRSLEPIFSIRLHRESRLLHVTRAVYCHVWEGYDAGNNTFLSRETCKWVQELAETIALDRYPDVLELEDELISSLFRAVVGSSRLPLTSMEAPLPDFSLGRLAYCHRPELAELSAIDHWSAPSEQPLQTWRELIESGLHSQLAEVEQVKLLEILMRSVPADEIGAVARHFAQRWQALGLAPTFLALCRSIFNEVALSPYTDFVTKFLLFLKELEAAGYLATEERADFLGYLLRQLGRHLTGYDLVTYHHQGANYPDALLLDEVLDAYLPIVSSRPDLFQGCGQPQRLRRRGLRQGCLLRLLYEGLPVPDAPTSPGENSRVLPAPYVRVPDEQIVSPARRRRRLFAQPLAALTNPGVQAVLVQALADLQTPVELRELGLALLIDRPLGRRKAPGEPDCTVLLSYEAFSATLAQRRLELLRARFPSLLDTAVFQASQATLAGLQGQGLPLQESSPAEAVRALAPPGTASLADVLRVAADFRLLCTTRSSRRAFLELFDFSVLEGLDLEKPGADDCFLIVDAAAIGQGPAGHLLFYRADLHPWLEAAVEDSQGFQSRAGLEYPVAGLRIVRAWDAGGAATAFEEASSLRIPALE
jgi:hypothetical protein